LTAGQLWVSDLGVQLRHHPLMSYRGVPNWPPVWTIGYATVIKTVKGEEVGILKHVIRHDAPRNRCFLIIEHEGERYIGTLLFDDATFCQQICRFLDHYIGCSIREIGSLEVTFTL
jgi:hypothetical protein